MKKFDIEAKLDEGDVSSFQSLDVDQRGLILQALLADRFRLKIHREIKELPVYALIAAKDGPKLRETSPDHVPAGAIKGFGGSVTRGGPGQLTVGWLTMPYFARLLSQQMDRIVVDKTGLTGHYDFKLDWAPDGGAVPVIDTSNGASVPPDPAGPSIFKAVQEQLGLKLEPQNGPLEVIVIDHVEEPSAN
jgi:uncharacterized protein (TIGR03435 family)